MLPTKFRFIWPSGFRGEDLNKLANQKQDLPVVAMFVNGLGQNEQSLERIFYRCFLRSFSSFGWRVSEEKIKMWKVNGRQTTSDGKSSHCLWQSELKRFTHLWNGKLYKQKFLKFINNYFHLYLMHFTIVIDRIRTQNMSSSYANFQNLHTRTMTNVYFFIQCFKWVHNAKKYMRHFIWTIHIKAVYTKNSIFHWHRTVNLFYTC